MESIKKSHAKEPRERDIVQAFVVNDESHPRDETLPTDQRVYRVKECLRIIGKSLGNNWGYFGEILERIIGNCMRIIGSSLTVHVYTCTVVIRTMYM